MPTYLLTIEAAESDSNGIRLSPGIRLNEMAGRPAFRTMMQGSSLELRSPSGVRYQTTLVSYGVEVERGEDGALYLNSDPKDAEIKFTISADLPSDALVAGTELWFVTD